MNSMTGFGRGLAALGEKRLSVEIRSTNHRGFDIKVRGRDLDAGCEIELLRAVRGGVERGAVTVSIREEDDAAAPVTFDLERARQLHASLEDLRRALKIPGPVNLAAVLGLLGHTAGGGRSEVGWDVLKPAVESAVSELVAMRGREGQSLVRDIKQRLATVERLVASIAAAVATAPARAAERLTQRIGALGTAAGVDPGRLAQEIAFLADKLDVTEELVRLRTHLEQLGKLLSDAPAGRSRAVGRTLEFVLQEVGREVNTVGSKVQDAGTAALVIECKAELEKIREQAQNIE